MTPGDEDALDDLVHDVNSQCSSLKRAVGLLKDSPPEELTELLKMMASQVEELARAIADFARKRRS